MFRQICEHSSRLLTDFSSSCSSKYCKQAITREREREEDDTYVHVGSSSLDNDAAECLLKELLAREEQIMSNELANHWKQIGLCGSSVVVVQYSNAQIG